MINISVIYVYFSLFVGFIAFLWGVFQTVRLLRYS